MKDINNIKLKKGDYVYISTFIENKSKLIKAMVVDQETFNPYYAHEAISNDRGGVFFGVSVRLSQKSINERVLLSDKINF